MSDSEALSRMVDLGSMYTLRWCKLYEMWFVELWDGWSPDIVQSNRILSEWKSEDLGEAVEGAWKAKRKRKADAK